MSWLRIDDGFIDHPKVLEGGERLGRFGVGRVIGQFLEGLAYASNKLTDGFLAVSAVKRFKVDPKPLQVAQVMVGVGLWHAVEGGYRIHDYHHYNPTAASVREKRTKDRTRKQDGDAQDSARNPRGSPKEPTRNPDGIQEDSTRNPDGENSARARKSQSQSQSGSQIRTGGVISRTEDGAPTEESPPALWRRLWEARWPEGICRTSQAELTELERLAAQLGSAELTARIERYVATDDTWLVDHKHPLGTFLRQINSYDGAKDMPAGRAEAGEAAKALKRVLWRAVGRDGRVWLESATVTQDGATVQLETTTPDKLAPYHDTFLEAVRAELGGDVELAIVAAEAGGA